MPELPEIEHLRRTLAPALVGTTIARVTVRRADVVRISAADGYRRAATNRSNSTMQRHLLAGECIERLARHGKQLAIIAESGRVICIHLGMSGQLFLMAREPKRVTANRTVDEKHIHCHWSVRQTGGPTTQQLIFRDPRRFGGIWTFSSFDELLEARWSLLGPDALTVTAKQLGDAISRSCRPIKSVLLDQSVIAGMGNIYADEALFGAGIHPLMHANKLKDVQITALTAAIRRTLQRAIKSGGSTLRDYRDGQGNSGTFQSRHAVYGRSGLPCLSCGSILQRLVVAQRSTVCCPNCQGRSPKRQGRAGTRLGRT
jgi:formamidopyrimidine-DNA glycosylase